MLRCLHLQRAAVASPPSERMYLIQCFREAPPWRTSDVPSTGGVRSSRDGPNPGFPTMSRPGGLRRVSQWTLPTRTIRRGSSSQRTPLPVRSARPKTHWMQRSDRSTERSLIGPAFVAVALCSGARDPDLTSGPHAFARVQDGLPRFRLSSGIRKCLEVSRPFAVGFLNDGLPYVVEIGLGALGK